MTDPHAATVPDAALDADGRPLPRLAEGRSRWLLALVLLLQLLSWTTLEGYQLADSVEYMERANSFAIGDDMEFTGVRRSFGFSALLAPFFWIAQLFDARDLGWVVVLCRCVQIALGLGLVHACHRLGARIGGASAGWVAGFLVGANPIFLQYAVSPVSGIASALFLAWGLNVLLDPGTPKRSLFGGLCLGAAVLMAYQSLVVVGPLLLFMLVRNRVAWWRSSAAVVAGLVLSLGVQVVLDRVSYGTWGVSLRNYLLENVGSVLSRQMWELGFEDAARALYDKAQEVRGDPMTPDPSAGVRQLQSPWFYLVEIRRMLVLPVLALFGVGVLRALRRPTWPVWTLILVFAANVFVMSFKGSKSFRLWLPLLPLIAPIAALGWTTLAGPWTTSLRARALQLLLVVALVMGARTMLDQNTRRFGVYWQAAEHVNDVVASDIERDGPRMIRHDVPDPPRVASAYHWAIFGRTSGDVVLQKLPHSLDVWRIKLDEEQREQMFEVLGEADWFLVHRPVLDQGRDLLEAVNATFDVAACFWNEDTDPELGPLLVMRRKGERRVPRSLFEVQQRVDDLEGYRRERDLDRGLPLRRDFVDPGAESDPERVCLLGWDYETLDGDGFGWITYHWASPTGVSRDYTVVDRITTPNGVYEWGLHPWQNNHEPARGALPFAEWRPGTLLRESYLVQAGSDAFTDDFHPMGGAWRRGELMVATLWMELARFDANGAREARLAPALPGADRPIDFTEGELLSTEGRAAAGQELTSDGLLHVGRFLLPVRGPDRWPDDGSPDPE